MARVRNPGQHLRLLRTARELTQEDVVRLAHGNISYQRISRIETGAVTKPPMEDLVTYGRVLGLTPNEMAALYGYWDEGKSEVQAELDEDVRIQRLKSVASRLDDAARERLFEWVDFAVAKAIADTRPVTAEVKYAGPAAANRARKQQASK